VTDPSGIALDVCNASFQTPHGTELIRPMSLSLAPGQRMAIVGPNGAGKSTLLRLLAGLLVPSAGHILLNRQRLQDIAPLARARKVAILGQAEHADARLRVHDYVALGCLPLRQTHSAAQLQAVVTDVLALCNLTALAPRSLGSLSGGERQRAHLARALAQRPQLLLLDEPTNHLDPRATADLLSLVRGLGITVVAVLHNLPLVPAWADQVAVLKAGALVRFAPPALALNPVTVHQVFAMHSYYLPHPHTAQPMLVLDTKPPEPAPGSSLQHRNSFFNHYEESTS
jgi:iron complex transport system ATP-binding protein